jgi:methylmalonyl-CoA mutase N-terminal domain/subunit
MRRHRDAGSVRRALDALEAGAMTGANTMPLLLEAVRAYATLGEMCDSLRKVWGEYVEDAII